MKIKVPAKYDKHLHPYTQEGNNMVKALSPSKPVALPVKKGPEGSPMEEKNETVYQKKKEGDL